MRCRKRGYRDELTALIILADIHRINRPSAAEHRAYPCGKCGGYHLTSQPARKGAVTDHEPVTI